MQLIDGTMRAEAEERRRLAERERAGDLDRGGLELAAFLGHGPAAELVPYVTPNHSEGDRRRQGALISSWGPLWLLCGDVALLSKGHGVQISLPEVRAAIDCVLEFLRRPSVEALELAKRRVEALDAPGHYGLEPVKWFFQEIQAPKLERDSAPMSKGVAWLGDGWGWSAREAVIERALTSPKDPDGHWMQAARWLEQRQAQGAMTLSDVQVLHACEYRPASIALGLDPLRPASLLLWLELLFALGRGLQVAFALIEDATMNLRLTPAQSNLLHLTDDWPSAEQGDAWRLESIERCLVGWETPTPRRRWSRRLGELIRCLGLARLGRRELRPADLLLVAEGEDAWSHRRRLSARLIRSALVGSTRAICTR